MTINKRRISNAKINFISLVDKAANKKSFLIAKAENGKAAFATFGKIVKTDSENHFVTGIVYEPMSVDTQGDYMTAEEIQKAAHWYAKNGTGVDVQHDEKKLDGACVVESWIAKADFT
ncbi:MAG: XkdF-like putative serine protease domain-containing protein, partial [Porcipelethomonas sp.]